MTGSHRPPIGTRRGFSLLEIQASFIVLVFSVAALLPFALGQLKLVTAMERRLPPNATYVLISKDHGLVSLLAAGGGDPPSAGTTDNTTSPVTNSRAIAIDQVQPVGNGRPMDLVATVTVKKPKGDSGPSSGGD